MISFGTSEEQNTTNIVPEEFPAKPPSPEKMQKNQIIELPEKKRPQSKAESVIDLREKKRPTSKAEDPPLFNLPSILR